MVTKNNTNTYHHAMRLSHAVKILCGKNRKKEEIGKDISDNQNAGTIKPSLVLRVH